MFLELVMCVYSNPLCKLIFIIYVFGIFFGVGVRDIVQILKMNRIELIDNHYLTCIVKLIALLIWPIISIVRSLLQRKINDNSN